MDITNCGLQSCQVRHPNTPFFFYGHYNPLWVLALSVFSSILLFLYIAFSTVLFPLFAYLLQYLQSIGFGGLEVACWPLVPKFAGSNPAEAVGIFKGENIFSTPSFGREVKPSVPCRRFAACKRSLELRGSRILRRNLSEHFSPTKSSTFRCYRSLASLDVKAPSGEGGNV